MGLCARENEKWGTVTVDLGHSLLLMTSTTIRRFNCGENKENETPWGTSLHDRPATSKKAKTPQKLPLADITEITLNSPQYKHNPGPSHPVRRLNLDSLSTATQVPQSLSSITARNSNRTSLKTQTAGSGPSKPGLGVRGFR